MQSVKAILFDADGVLQRVPGTRDVRIADLVGNERIKDFMDDVWAAEEPCLSGNRKFEEEIGALLKRWNANSNVLEFFKAWHSIESDENMMNIVKDLRENYVVCLATNQELNRAAHMSKALKYESLFHHSFYSCELGVAKPSAVYFSRIIAQLGLSGSEVIFIDDNQANVDGAKSIGLHAELYHLDEGAEKLIEILRSYGVATA